MALKEYKKYKISKSLDNFRRFENTDLHCTSKLFLKCNRILHGFFGIYICMGGKEAKMLPSTVAL